jgi:hypothetical protein
MTPYTAFLDYVLPETPGCTNEVALLALKNTVIDFCEKSLIHQVDHDPITLAKGIIDYDLEPLKDTLVTKIIKVYYKDQPLNPIAPDDIGDGTFYNRFYQGAQIPEGPPQGYFQKDARTVSVVPFPRETERLALTMRVALKPTRSASQVTDFLFEEYAETIGHGAISRLALSKNKPYYDPGLAGARNVLYTAGINMARQRANKGYTRSVTQVRLRRI